MLNFLTNTFQAKSNARSVCGNFDGETDVIQGCFGCDDGCLFSCSSTCADECQGNSIITHDTGDGTCNSECRGTCFDLVSIFLGGK